MDYFFSKPCSAFLRSDLNQISKQEGLSYEGTRDEICNRLYKHFMKKKRTGDISLSMSNLKIKDSEKITSPFPSPTEQRKLEKLANSLSKVKISKKYNPRDQFLSSNKVLKINTGVKEIKKNSYETGSKRSRSYDSSPIENITKKQKDTPSFNLSQIEKKLKEMPNHDKIRDKSLKLLINGGLKVNFFDIEKLAPIIENEIYNKHLFLYDKSNKKDYSVFKENYLEDIRRLYFLFINTDGLSYLKKGIIELKDIINPDDSKIKKLYN